MPHSQPPSANRWYADVTRYQWLVLVIASAGWLFDTYEGQIFNITRAQMLVELLGPDSSNLDAKRWGDILLAVFLVGGTIGGIAFGTLADRFGRKRTMAATILIYSVFSGLTYFATELWHIAVLRFLVAIGVGGEWAVAASLVAEVFPPHARARASGIFQSMGIVGTWLAALVALAVGAHWRYAYLFGLLPALLVFWVRSGLEEPKRWQQPESFDHRLGSFRELFGVTIWARHSILGLSLAAIGLGTFWGVVVAGQDLVYEVLLREGVPDEAASQRAKFSYGIMQALGAGVGLLSFAPIAERIGRRGAFALMHGMAFMMVPVTCWLPLTYLQLLVALPIFSFFAISIHAGYAIYFPELFPNHLRATGLGVCFNGGKLLAAPVLIFSGVLKADLGLRPAVTVLGCLFLLGLVIVFFLPETKGRPLPG